MVNQLENSSKLSLKSSLNARDGVNTPDVGLLGHRETSYFGDRTGSRSRVSRYNSKSEHSGGSVIPSRRLDDGDRSQQNGIYEIESEGT